MNTIVKNCCYFVLNEKNGKFKFDVLFEEVKTSGETVRYYCDNNEVEKEEEYLMYPGKIEESYSYEDYERTFQYAIKKINTSKDNTRDVLNALVTIALHFDRSEIKRFYNEKAKTIKNPVLQSRINYILSCFEEELYLEYQASQYEASQYEGSIDE